MDRPARTEPATTAVALRGDYTVNPTYTRSSQFSDNESDGNLLEYWHLLVRRKKAIAVGSLAGLILGFAIGIPLKPVFRAQTTLEVLTLNGDFLNQKQSNPTTTNDGNFDTSEEETQAKLLQGTALLERVIDKLDPTARSAGNPKLATSGWRSWLHLHEAIVVSTHAKLVLKAVDTLKVKSTPRTRILEVTLDSTDPQLATDFANTLSREFIAQNIEARWATSQSTSEWMRRELDDARTRLRSSEDALQNYAATSGLIFTNDEDNVATEKLLQVQLNLSAATVDRISKEARFELAQKSPPDSLGDVLNDDNLREAWSQIDQLKGQLADTSTVFVQESSKVQRLQADIDSRQRAFDQQKMDIVARISNDYTEAKRKEKLLAATYDEQAREVIGLDEKAVQYNILKRDVDSNRALYDTMQQQMKEASISSAIRAGNVRVVDPAELPNLPIFPNFKLNSALGLVFGFFASIFFVTIRDRADRTLQQPGDIKLWTDVIELGAIPNSTLSPRGGKYYRPLASVNGDHLHNGAAKKQPLSLPPTAELITAQNTSSITAEAFRSALASMLFISNEEQRPRVIVFTSANAGDGKTTVVSNIGIAAAELRMKVLLIDADVRRPRLHHVFKLDNGGGLSSVLTGESGEHHWSSFIQSTEIKNLSVLPAGPPSHSASHMLYSPSWGQLLNNLREEYDMILIDTPPMQMTDARVASRSADAVVLIARSNLTTRDVMIAAKDRLVEDHTPILGAILNDWDPKQSANGYYRGTYYRASHYNT